MANDESLSRVSSEEFYNNLLLLGFEGSREHEWLEHHSTPFSSSSSSSSSVVCPEMFSRSNELGLLCIVHFLLSRFSKLSSASLSSSPSLSLTGDSEDATSLRREKATNPKRKKKVTFLKEKVEAMESFFPPSEHSHRREWKKTAREVLLELELQGDLPTGVGRGSVLNMAKGRPAQNLVWALSITVLHAESQLLEQEIFHPLDQESHSHLQQLPTYISLSQVDKAKEWRRAEQRKLEEEIERRQKEQAEMDTYKQELEDQKAHFEHELESLEQALKNESEQVDLLYNRSGHHCDPSLLHALVSDPFTDKLERQLDLVQTGVQMALNVNAPSAESFIRGQMRDRLKAMAGVEKASVDKEELEACLARVERVKRDIAKLAQSLSVGLEELNQTRARNAGVLLGMR